MVGEHQETFLRKTSRINATWEENIYVLTARLDGPNMAHVYFLFISAILT